jgi:hypothetical protein
MMLGRRSVGADCMLGGTERIVSGGGGGELMRGRDGGGGRRDSRAFAIGRIDGARGRMPDGVIGGGVGGDDMRTARTAGGVTGGSGA